MEPLLASEVDVSKITYGVPNTLSSGAKHIRVQYKRGPLLVQTPEMVTPFGVNKWGGDNGQVAKYSLDLSFKDHEEEERKDLRAFKEMLERLDKKIVDDAFSGTLPSHNRKFTTRDVVDALFTQSIKQKDDKYPPNFKVSLQRDANGVYSFPTYMVDPQTDGVVVDAETGRPKKVDLDTLQVKRGSCSVIMQCSGIWVAGMNFGCTWKVTQLRVRPSTYSKNDYAFKDKVGFSSLLPLAPPDEDEEDEDVDIEAIQKSTAAVSIHKDSADELEDEDDEEEEDDEEDEQEPEVKKKPAAAKAAGKK